MQKIKSIVMIIVIMLVTVAGLTSCRHCCKKEGKCCKEMCAKDSCCKKACKDDGSCCMKDKKACCAKDKEEKKACCEKGGMHGSAMHDGMYHCPMDSGVTSDKPGKCPKCGMELKKTEKTE